MMKELITIFEKIDFDKRLIKIYNKEIVPPNFFEIWKPVEDFFYPFPPFFIPLFIDQGDPSYIGIIQHFFTDREQVFVQYDLSSGYMWEIARNSDQLLLDILIQSIENNDDIIDDSIKEFAKDIKFDLDNDFLNTYNNEYDGDSFDTYSFFDLFSNNTPSAYIKHSKEYEGDFPSIRNKINEKTIAKCSSFEIDEEIDLTKIKNLPLWLNNNALDKKELFEEFLLNLNIENAWFTLNSKDWKYSQIKDGLIKLRERKTNNSLYKLVSQTWIDNWEGSDYDNKDILMY